MRVKAHAASSEVLATGRSAGRTNAKSERGHGMPSALQRPSITSNHLAGKMPAVTALLTEVNLTPTACATRRLPSASHTVPTEGACVWSMAHRNSIYFG